MNLFEILGHFLFDEDDFSLQCRFLSLSFGIKRHNLEIYFEDFVTSLCATLSTRLSVTFPSSLGQIFTS